MRIFLVTPLRDELDNIPRLFEAVEKQGTAISLWVTAENGSTDGSRELLSAIKKPANVEELVVLNIDTEAAEYAVGSKYARIVNRGFEEVKERRTLGDDDAIGILDADSFPQPGYYEKLCAHFAQDPKLGITSGTSLEDETGRKSHHRSDWVRGSCRLWRGACFLQSGYVVGPSADTLSAARAELDGWRVAVTEGAVFIARTVGDRTKQGHYGATVFFRGHSPVYALMRSLKLIGTGRFSEGRDFWSGYSSARRRGDPQLEDEELKRYFKSAVRRRFAAAFGSKN